LGLTPANGSSPIFQSLDKSLADSNNNKFIGPTSANPQGKFSNYILIIIPPLLKYLDVISSAYL
ncbi:MAG: hypothetical protein K2M00_09125, partial [Muribaculaceae bacterium]|nr:hypothetical protein [Muribaculaceae bacterium]